MALLGLAGGERQHALLAQADELGDPERLDVALRREAQVALDVDLDPQALAVEAVLEPLVLAQHRVEPLVQVLVGAAPGVVDAHRVVGGDRPVEEAPARAARVLRPEPRERAPVRPLPEQRRAPGRRSRVGWRRGRTSGLEGRGPRPGPGLRAGDQSIDSRPPGDRRATAPRGRPSPRTRFRRSDVSCRAMSSPRKQRAAGAHAPHAIRVRRGVPVPDLPRARSRLRGRLPARAGLRRAAVAADRAGRRDLPARRPARPHRASSSSRRCSPASSSSTS